MGRFDVEAFGLGERTVIKLRKVCQPGRAADVEQRRVNVEQPRELVDLFRAGPFDRRVGNSDGFPLVDQRLTDVHRPGEVCLRKFPRFAGGRQHGGVEITSANMPE